MLFKFLKYLFIFIAACVLVAVLFSSCKSNIIGKITFSPKTSDSNQNKQINPSLFGSLFINACSERMKGNLQEALILMQQCKKIDPSNAAVYFELGTINNLLGNKNEALSNAFFCANSDLKNEWYQLLLIDCLIAIKNYDQVIKVRETLIKNFPNNNDYKEYLAHEYGLVGKYEKALIIYNEIEKNHGVSEQLILKKVKFLKNLNKMNEAEAELIKLTDSNKNDVFYYAYLAEFYVEQNKWVKAKIIYDKMLSIEPDNPIISMALTEYYKNEGNDALSRFYLKKAFQNPNLEHINKLTILETFYKEAIHQPDTSIIEKGLELSKITIATHPKIAEAKVMLANFFMLNNNFKDAANYYYLAVENKNQNFSVWDKLLFCEYKLLKFDSIERHSSLAKELFPGHPMAYFYNGLANYQLGNYFKAIESLTVGIEFVVDQDGLMVDFYTTLGDAYNNLKEYAKSDLAFEKALKINSDNTYILNNYAYYLSLRNEKLELAEKFSKHTNELNPNNKNYMDTYGWILYQQKKYLEAEAWLLKASKIGLNNPIILEHYGDVLFKLNKKEEAFKNWNLSRENGGSSESLLKKIKDLKINE